MTLLIDLLVKSSLLLVVATALVLLMRRASAASRHLVWTGLFAGVMLMPLAMLALPPVRIAVLAPAAPQPVTTLAPLPVSASVPTAESRAVDFSGGLAVPMLAGLPTPVPSPPFIRLTPGRVLTSLWLIGFVVLLVRAAIGRVRVRALGERASLVGQVAVLDRIDQIRRQLHVRRSITLRESADECMPMTWGVLRPTILVSSNAVSSIRECPERLDAIFVHEVSHVARFDAVSQWLTNVSVAVCWVNPLFWFAARQARLDRERACDDAVLASGAKASDYASQLLMLAQWPGSTGAALAMAQPSQLERRVRSILDVHANRSGLSRLGLWLTVALVGCTLPVAAARLSTRSPENSAPTAAPLERASSQRADASMVGTSEGVTVQTGIRATADVQPARLERTSGSPRDQVQRPSLLVPPPPPTFIIGVGDVLIVTVWRAPEVSGEVRVRSDGKIALSRGGDLLAAGLTVDALKQAVAAELARFYAVAPDVFIQVKEINSRQIFLPRSLPGAGMTQFQLVSSSQQGESPFQPADTVQKLAAARQSLADLQLRGMSDEHPEVIYLKALVARLTQEVNAGPVNATQRADRLDMIQELINKARAYRHDLNVKVEIGTSAALDVTGVDQIVKQLDALKAWAEISPAPSEAEMPAIRLRFAATLREIDAAMVRFDNGLVSGAAVEDALMAAGDVVRQTAPMADADLIAALRRAATITPDTARADALLTLAQRNAFSPEMVALYVAAANGIVSDTERSRVFAQPIRIKSK